LSEKPSEKPPESRGLEFTGERVVPGLVDPNLFNEHLARYRFAALFAGGARVLDAGCGSGYGVAELGRAGCIFAMDIAADAIAHASRAFAASNVRFLQGRCEDLPFVDASLDLVVAFEVIEHLEDWRKLLTEARRVLLPSGTLLVSTPNKAFYAESRAAVGPNPYHVHEFEYREFEAALQAEFPHVHLWTQNHSEAITFVPASASCGTFDAVADAAPETAHFFLAACSRSPITLTSAFAWLPSAGNVLRERQQHIALLEGEVAQKNQWLSDAQKSQSGLQREYDKLEAELRRSNDWAEHLNLQVANASGVIDELREELRTARAGYENQIAESEMEAATRLQWVAQLEEQLARERAELAQRTEWAHSLDREMQQERIVYRKLEQQHLETQEHLKRTQAELERVKGELAFTEAQKWVRFGRSLSLMNKSLPGDSNG